MKVKTPGPDLSLESAYSGLIAGVDEAGRGPLAGPVVAAAVVLDLSCIPDGIDDSKKLTRAQREALFDCLSASCLIGVGIAEVEEIDRINILHASMSAMSRAVANLGKLPALALIDGNRCPKLDCEAKAVIGGDALSLSIAAASIIAKVTRDRIMCELATQFSGYGWEQNCGYGTKKHHDAISRLGVTPHHRRSFATVRNHLEAALQAQAA